MFWKNKYMEIGRHRGMIANEHIRIGCNSYEKVKIFKYLNSLVTDQNFIQEEKKREIHIIIRLKTLYHLGFSLGILKLNI